MTMSDVIDPPQRQVVCAVPIAAATEQVLRAWVRELEADPATWPCYSRANCGVVQQRQWMRIIVGRALDGRHLTQQDADQANAATGNPFIPTTLPALADVLQSVLREDANTRPASIAVVEAAYRLTS